MPYTNDELYDMFRKLPVDVREAYGSIEFMNALGEMEKKHHLHIDQSGELSNEIYKLVLGLTPPQQFADAVKTALRVPAETAKQITEEVNTLIFRPIKESLMQIHKMKDEGDKPQNEPVIKEGVPASEILEAAQTREESKLHVNLAEEKLLGSFSLQKKSGPDPYRESV